MLYAVTIYLKSKMLYASIISGYRVIEIIPNEFLPASAHMQTLLIK